MTAPSDPSKRLFSPRQSWLQSLRAEWRLLVQQPAFSIGLQASTSGIAGTAAWGLVTGAILAQSGLRWEIAYLMTLTVFAASAQLAALPLILAGAPLSIILGSAFCVNLRFVVYSLHLRPYLIHLPLPRRLLMGYLTADIPYVIFISRYPTPAKTDEERTEQQAFLAANSIVFWLTWQVSSLIGLCAAIFIPKSWGLGHIGMVSLLVIVATLVKTWLQLLAVFLAGALALLAWNLPFKLNVMAALVITVGVCLGCDALVQQFTKCTKRMKRPAA